jgi:hypothetical protein
MDFKIKYLKYKKKYLNLKKIVGGYKFIFEGKEYDIKDYRDELKKLIKKIQNSKENENIITDKILIFLLEEDFNLLEKLPNDYYFKLKDKIKDKRNKIIKLNNQKYEYFKDSDRGSLKIWELTRNKVKMKKKFILKDYIFKNINDKIQDYTYQNNTLDNNIKNNKIKLDEFIKNNDNISIDIYSKFIKEDEEKIEININKINKLEDDKIKLPILNSYDIISDIIESNKNDFDDLLDQFYSNEENEYYKNLHEKILINLKKNISSSKSFSNEIDINNLKFFFNIEFIDNLSNIILISKTRNKILLNSRIKEFNQKYPSFFGLEYNIELTSLFINNLSILRKNLIKSIIFTNKIIYTNVLKNKDKYTLKIKNVFFEIFNIDKKLSFKNEKKQYNFYDYSNLIDAVCNIIIKTNGNVSFPYMFDLHHYKIYKIKDNENDNIYISSYHYSKNKYSKMIKNKKILIENINKFLIKPILKNFFLLSLQYFLELNILEESNQTTKYVKDVLINYTRNIFYNIKDDFKLENDYRSSNKKTYDNFIEFFIINLCMGEKRYICLPIGIDDYSYGNQIFCSYFKDFTNIKSYLISCLLGKHSNLMIIDFNANKYYLFEPHGQLYINKEKIYNSIKDIFKTWCDDINNYYNSNKKYLNKLLNVNDEFINNKLNFLKKYKFNNQEIPKDPLQSNKPNCVGWSCLIVFYLHFTNFSIVDIIKKIKNIPMEKREEKMTEFILFCNDFNVNDNDDSVIKLYKNFFTPF